MLYGLFKQATEGDADPKDKPGMFNLKGKAKWEAWNTHKEKSSEIAKLQYIQTYSTLKDAHKEEIKKLVQTDKDEIENQTK